MPFEKRFETGRISVKKGSKRVLVKVVLFQLSGCGHPQDDATPSFFINSKSSVLGLSNDISFFAWEGGQNSKIVRGIISWPVCFFHHCRANTVSIPMVNDLQLIVTNHI